MNKGLILTTLICILGSLTGCISPPPIEGRLSELKAPESWSEQGEIKYPDKWWEAFLDEDLNKLVDQALADNLDVRTALARLEQATALAGVSKSGLLPSLDAAYSYTDTNPENPAINKSSVTLSASYEIDLWGRNLKAARASQASLMGSVEDTKTAVIAIAANIATNWYELVSLREKLNVLDTQLKVNEHYLGLLVLKFKQGQISQADVLQQEQKIVATRSEIGQTELQITLREHTIAVLLGKPPKTEATGSRKKLPDLPLFPDTGVPSDLLRNRPDIIAAEFKVRSAHFGLGEAMAARFPRLSITAGRTWQGDSFKNTFDNWVDSLVANLLGPIFDGGARKREVERTRAVVNEYVASYKHSVLNALKEVEDALAKEKHSSEYKSELQQQLSLAREAQDHIRVRYLNGQADYSALFASLTSVQQLELTGIEADKNAILYRIDLYRALGGGWESLLNDIQKNEYQHKGDE